MDQTRAQNCFGHVSETGASHSGRRHSPACGRGLGVLAASWGWVAARPGEQSRTHSGQHQEAEAGSPELRVRFAESICVQGGVGSV